MLPAGFGERIDALRLARVDGRFVPTPVRADWVRAKYQLMGVWLEYVSTISTADWALSLESSAYLLWLLRRLKPSLLLDTGSGFSSYVFRRYQAEHAGDDVVVVSVDSSRDWLAATEGFLARHGLSTVHLETWDEFERRAEKRFDFVLHDIGPRELRIRVLPDLLREASPHAPLILDDGQFPEIGRAARSAVRDSGRRVYSLRRYTLDETGRFALLVSPVRS